MALKSGVAAAKSLRSFFASAAGNHTMDVLHGLGINPQSQSYRASLLEIPAGSLSGKTFVITGTLSHPRDYFEQLIASHGGKATGAISKSTSCLLAGSGGGSKRDKALKLACPSFRGRLLQNDRELIAAKQRKREAGTETHASCAQLPVSSYSLRFFPCAVFRKFHS